jgi:peroxiredoxin
LYGETLTLDALRAPGKPVLLVFSDPGCGPCSALMPDIGRWQREHAAALTVALVSRGTPEANRAKSTEHGVMSVLLQQDREVAQEYQAHGTPSAVLVRPDGTIGSPLAMGADAIRALVARTVGQPIPLPIAPAPAGGGSQNGHAPPPPAPPALKIGDPAPALALPDLNGKKINLSDFRGRNTLVLFWNPGCGFCQQMLDDLKSCESARPKGAPGLLVVSTGTVEANQAMGLRSPVLLDQNFTAGRAFAANGTPMAVLVDAKGRIASEVAAGGPAVLALARKGEVPMQSGAGGR